MSYRSVFVLFVVGWVFCGCSKSGSQKKETLPAKHTVEKGDTVTNLSVKYYGNASGWRQILKANSLENANEISVGQVLQIPLPVNDLGAPPSTNEPMAKAGDKPPTTYVVQPGDTFSSISRKFYGDDTNVRYLAETNSIQNPNQLGVGMRLNIPTLPPDKNASSTSEKTSPNGENTSALKPPFQSVPAKDEARSADLPDSNAK
jgi:LysM repeat protein